MRGGAQSSLLQCSDGNLYVVKMMGNPQGTAVLANEFVGGMLCAALGFSVPSSCVVYLPSDFLRSTPEMWFETSSGRRCPEAGIQYGSRLIGEVCGSQRAFEYLPSRLIPTVDNWPEYLGFYLFDIWANHHDRRQAIFTVDPIRQSTKATFIDQGSLFGGPAWTFQHDDYQQVFRSQDRPSATWDPESVVHWIERFRQIIPSTLSHAFKHLPAEWNPRQLRPPESILLERLAQLESVLSRYYT